METNPVVAQIARSAGLDVPLTDCFPGLSLAIPIAAGWETVPGVYRQKLLSLFLELGGGEKGYLPWFFWLHDKDGFALVNLTPFCLF